MAFPHSQVKIANAGSLRKDKCHWFFLEKTIYEKNRTKICFYEILRINLHYESCRSNQRSVFTVIKIKKMPDKFLSKPTDAELEILQVLWENGPSSVRFVNDELSERRDVGYTTTLKLMQIMFEKGLVTRNTDARSHIYEAAIDKDETQRTLLDNFVDNVFSGSAMNLVMSALGSHQASKEELDQIKALIERIEGAKD